MAALAPGILLKLLDAMGTGTSKPIGEHRNALLQITDIVPAELDEKALFPKHGFYIKVSDSSHSIYVSLPFDQDDLVLSNKMQLGQFVHVERLDPGEPVPVMKGAKLLPGRHPLVGAPETIGRVAGVKPPTRGSWDRSLVNGGCASPAVVKSVGFDVECGGTTPGRFRQSSPVVRCRSSVSGGLPLLPKVAESGDDGSSLGSALRSSLRMGRSKSVSGREQHRIPQSPFSADRKNSTPLSRVRERTLPAEASTPVSATARKPLYQPPNVTALPKSKEGLNNNMPLPGKLGLLGKEVLQQQEAAQKVALQALRDASAAETLVRLVKTFSMVSSTAKAEAPANCFCRFLSFHQEITQAITDIEAIQAVVSDRQKQPGSKSKQQVEEDRSPSILHEISHNVNLIKNLGRHRRTKSSQKACENHSGTEAEGSENKNRAQNSSSLGNYVKLAKKLQTEAGLWFMEFLDAALESGLKKPTRGDEQKECCPQSVILKVINWVEVEQSDSSKRPVHPRAAHVARKLRIKVKNR